MAELDAHRPFGFVRADPPQPGEQLGTGHMLIVTGYADCDAGHAVEIFDPQGAYYIWRNYRSFSSGDSQNFMVGTFYKIQRSNTPRCFAETRNSGYSLCAEADQCRGSYPLSLSTAGADAADKVPLDSKDKLDAANLGLDMVMASGASRPRSLGFASAQEALTARLDQKSIEAGGYNVIDAYLDANGDIVAEKAQPLPDHRFYIFDVGDEPRGVIRIETSRGKWRPVLYDHQPIPLLHSIANATATTDITIVYMAAVNTYFLRRDKQWMPLSEMGRLRPGAFTDIATFALELAKHYPPRTLRPPWIKHLSPSSEKCSR